MILKKLDFSHKELEEILPYDIPNDTEELDASYNNLFELDSAIFYKKVRIWLINLSHNQISSSFVVLKVLDFSIFQIIY